MTLRAHRGATLAELAVAIVLTGVVAAIGGAILVAAERRTRADASSDRDGQATRDVVHLLTGEIEPALPDSLAVRGDTALDLEEHVGAAVACAVAGPVVVVPGASVVAGVPFVVWRRPPESGDLLIAWDTASGGSWRRALVDSVSAPPDGAGCGTGGPFRTAADSVAGFRVTRLRLDQPLTAGVIPGAPVRVFRGARWFLHRESNRAWALGYRRCTRGACSAAQPVAGPLASASDSGLSFRAVAPGMIEVSVTPVGAAGRARVTVGVRGAPSATR